MQKANWLCHAHTIICPAMSRPSALNGGEGPFHFFDGDNLFNTLVLAVSCIGKTTTQMKNIIIRIRKNPANKSGRTIAV